MTKRTVLRPVTLWASCWWKFYEKLRRFPGRLNCTSMPRRRARADVETGLPPFNQPSSVHGPHPTWIITIIIVVRRSRPPVSMPEKSLNEISELPMGCPLCCIVTIPCCLRMSNQTFYPSLVEPIPWIKIDFPFIIILMNEP